MKPAYNTTKSVKFYIYFQKSFTMRRPWLNYFRQLKVHSSSTTFENRPRTCDESAANIRLWQKRPERDCPWTSLRISERRRPIAEVDRKTLPRYLLEAFCCSFKIAWNMASSMSASTLQPAASMNGFTPPFWSFAYFSCMRYCAA